MTEQDYTTVYTAVALTNNANDFNEPLLLQQRRQRQEGLDDESHLESHADSDIYRQEQQQTSSTDAIPVRELKLTSLLLGILVGFFIHLSTLGMNVILAGTTKFETADVVYDSKTLMMSIIWSFSASIVAVLALEPIRTIYESSIQSRSKHECRDHAPYYSLFETDACYIIGFFIGVISLWSFTEIILGIKIPIMYFVTPFFLMFFLYRYFTGCPYLFKTDDVKSDNCENVQSVSSNGSYTDEIMVV